MSQVNDLWAFDLCRAYPLPENQVLVRNPRNGRHAVLMPDVHQALGQCREFRTLDEHAARLVDNNPRLGGQQDAVRQVLESVKNDGLLISAGIYPTLFPPAARPRELADKPVAAVITWERPEALARCLQSAASNCELEALERFYVIDDSRSQEAQSSNRKATEAFAETARLPVQYVGPDEQKQLMERIIKQVPALEDAVRFLIDRERWAPYWTSGLGRTVALLLSVGRRLLVLDDDILCEVFEPFTESGQVSFADSSRDAAFYQDNEQWQGLKAAGDTDPLARHTRVLGLEITDALGALGAQNLEHDGLVGAPLEQLEKLRADSKVLVTECGSLGDPGTAYTSWLAGLEGESLARLLASDESVASALDIRNCWSGRSRSTIAAHANMSQLTGLDNRALLPPYIPIMRGEDRLFGSMVEFLHPGSVVLDSAWAVPHLPIPARRWTAQNRAFNTAEPFPGFCLSLVSDNIGASNSTDPIRRLGHMARLFEDLADLDHEQMVQHYVDHKLDTKTNRFNHLKSVRTATCDAPQAWLDYLDEGIARLNGELIDNPVEMKLRGYPEGLEDDALTEWWQDFWKRFAHAMRSWPAIRQAARNCTP